jgi:hypothetical protein
MNERRRSITLVKGRQRFVFRYPEGREADLLAALLTLANDPDSAFDWFDAAAISLRMGRSTDSEPGPARDDRSREARCRTKS